MDSNEMDELTKIDVDEFPVISEAELDYLLGIETPESKAHEMMLDIMEDTGDEE